MLGQLVVLSTIGFLSSFGMYQMFFKGYELRTMYYVASVITLVGMFIDLWQVYRYNIKYGISDFTLICFGSVVLGTITEAMTFLPFMVMVQKLAPEGVEASILAIMYSMNNLTAGLLPQMIGAFINNRFVGMTKDKMYLYKYLVYIQIGGQLISFLTIWLIPVKSDLENYAQVFDEPEESQTNENGETNDEFKAM